VNPPRISHAKQERSRAHALLMASLQVPPPPITSLRNCHSAPLLFFAKLACACVDTPSAPRRCCRVLLFVVLLSPTPFHFDSTDAGGATSCRRHRSDSNQIQAARCRCCRCSCRCFSRIGCGLVKVYRFEGERCTQPLPASPFPIEPELKPNTISSLTRITSSPPVSQRRVQVNSRSICYPDGSTHDFDICVKRQPKTSAGAAADPSAPCGLFVCVLPYFSADGTVALIRCATHRRTLSLLLC
jgi:hypothetical protein